MNSNYSIKKRKEPNKSINGREIRKEWIQIKNEIQLLHLFPLGRATQINSNSRIQIDFINYTNSPKGREKEIKFILFQSKPFSNSLNLLISLGAQRTAPRIHLKEEIKTRIDEIE